jgi:hypothetical protein
MQERYVALLVCLFFLGIHWIGGAVQLIVAMLALFLLGCLATIQLFHTFPGLLATC